MHSTPANMTGMDSVSSHAESLQLGPNGGPAVDVAVFGVEVVLIDLFLVGAHLAADDSADDRRPQIIDHGGVGHAPKVTERIFQAPDEVLGGLPPDHFTVAFA
jgi:hypothetical protein